MNFPNKPGYEVRAFLCALSMPAIAIVVMLACFHTGETPGQWVNAAIYDACHSGALGGSIFHAAPVCR